MNDTEAWTAEKIDALKPGRDLDVLVETRVMGRKVSFGKGAAVAMDHEKRPILFGPDDWRLEDYDPARDGAPAHFGLHDPRIVFYYSQYDAGAVRVLTQLERAEGLSWQALAFEPDGAGWLFTVRWREPGVEEVRTVFSRDPASRMAVYKGALKAMIL